MIESETAQSPGVALDGLSLQDAYLLFLKMNFSNPDLPAIEGPGPMMLTSDASEALSRIERRLGVIERHPDLMVADDDCDGVAMRLIAGRAIDIDEARDDILVHRHFWKLFEGCEWTMTGRAANAAADERAINPRLFIYFRVFRLRQSIIDDGEPDGARFVDVRVYPAEHLSKLPRGAAPLEEPDRIEEALDALGIDSPKHRIVGKIMIEAEISLSAPFGKEQQEFFRREFEKRGIRAISDDAMRKRFEFCCDKFKAGHSSKD
jgi:hypothetical protein